MLALDHHIAELHPAQHICAVHRISFDVTRIHFACAFFVGQPGLPVQWRNCVVVGQGCHYAFNIVCGIGGVVGVNDRTHRSTSPNTMSNDPNMAATSASIWPLLRWLMAAKWANPGARILARYGLFVPSETR